jgi:hypothetical protein
MGYSMDFDKIWRERTMSENLKSMVARVAGSVHGVLTAPRDNEPQNVTEWAKKEACWSRVSSLDFEWAESLQDELITKRKERILHRHGRRDQRELNDWEIQTKVVGQGTEFWLSVEDWDSSRNLLTPGERAIMNVLKAIPSTGKIPDVARCRVIWQALDRLGGEGFPNQPK